MTRLFSILIGLALTLALLGLMVFVRLLSPPVEDQPDLELREIELVEWVDPPPPPEPEEPAEDTPPPPPVAMLANLPQTSDPEAPTVASTDLPIPVELGVEEFSMETSVAALPQRTTPVKPKQNSSSKPAKPTNRAPQQNKSSYSIGELDGKPRVVSTPSIRFPRSLTTKGIKSGKVMVEVVISPSGRSSLRRIVSSSRPELRAAATRIANGARFTPPKKNGQAVTAIMRWPLIIR